MKINSSLWLSLFFAVLLGIAVVTAIQWSWDTRLFPWTIGIPALFLALCQVFVDLTNSEVDGDEASTRQILDIPTDQSLPKEVTRRGTVVAFGWLMSFAVSVWLVGFLVASPLFIFFYLRYQARAKMTSSCTVAGLTTLFIWGLFDQIMHVAWPDAVFFKLLSFEAREDPLGF